MKHKGILFIAAIMILSIFTGCTNGSYISIGSIENNTSSSMSMSYAKFTGKKWTDIQVKKGESVEIAVEIVTEDGSIHMAVDNEEGKSFYQGTDMPTSSFTVTLKEEGKYKLSINAKGHKGSYKISWNKG